MAQVQYEYVVDGESKLLAGQAFCPILGSSLKSCLSPMPHLTAWVCTHNLDWPRKRARSQGSRRTTDHIHP